MAWIFLQGQEEPNKVEEIEEESTELSHLTFPCKVDSLEKNPDTGRDWGQEEEGTTGDEMAGWHHRLYGYEFEQAPGVGDG